MRRKGEKIAITPESPRIVGHLTVFRHTNAWRGDRPMMIAMLLEKPDSPNDYLLEDLEDAHLGPIKGRWFIIKGVQHDRRGKKIFATHPQAWLCRQVSQAI